MQIGVVFPQSELGSASAAELRRYATTVESLGFAHVLAYDHVLGADPAAHAPWNGPYDIDTTFREPFVFFGFLAACTNLELVTGVIILPQRQTALVAKQATELDLLTGGRFRLGVGIGWNPVEYEALGEAFDRRGRRMSEQIPLLRRLFTERAVNHQGDFDRITAAGLAPLPATRPIPIWVGGHSPPAYRRMGRLADGWFPQMAPGPRLDEARAIVDDAAVAAGRDPTTLGIEGRVAWTPDGGIDQLVDHVGRWREAGATHLSVNTMNAGLDSVDHHLDVLADIASAIDLTPTDTS